MKDIILNLTRIMKLFANNQPIYILIYYFGLLYGYELMPEREVILNYQGLFNFEIIGHLLNSLKDETEARNISISHYKKILSVMIEALENVFKYNEFFENESRLFPSFYPKFELDKLDNSYFLTTCNPILNKDIEKLSNHISKINNLDKEGLRQLFRNTLTNGQFSSKGGAGLGFIEMAKVSGEKIDFSFEPIDTKYSYYSCMISITNNDLNAES
jgi:hypothetical protein